MTSPHLRVYPDADQLAKAAAVEIEKLAVDCVKKNGRFSMALSGGSTPKKLYKFLADRASFPAFPWDKTDLFFGDERCVPPDDGQSNYRMTKETLLAHGFILPEAQLHRVLGEADPQVAAATYEQVLKDHFGAASLPKFDLILLGMGDDGHTASLFPGSLGLDETEKWVIANWVEKFKSYRITFTYPVLNQAAHLFLLVAGPDKTARLAEILGTDTTPRPTYPVEKVQLVSGEKVWWLDEAAAARLTSRPV